MNDMNQPKVAIIIISWKCFDDISACIPSLKAMDYTNYEIVVVENASPDGSGKRITMAFPGITVISNESNLGYGAGNNVGIRHALAHGAKYAWLLNADTRVEPSTLRILVERAEAEPDAGLVCPVLYDYVDVSRIQNCGVRIDRKKWDFIPVKTLDALDQVPTQELLVWTTAALARRELLTATGGLNEEYFVYHEDMDLSLSARRLGLKIIVEKGAKIYHKSHFNDKGGRPPPHYYFYLTRNEILLWKKFLPADEFRNFLTHWTAKALRDFGHFRDLGDRDRSSALMEGLWSGIRGETGTWKKGHHKKSWLELFWRRLPYKSADLIEGNFNGVVSSLFAGAKKLFLRKRIPAKTTVTFLLNIPAGGGWGGCEDILLHQLSFVDYDAHRVILMVNYHLLFPKKIRDSGIPVEIMNFPFSLEDTRFWPRILKMYRFLSSLGTRRVIFVHNIFLQFGLADFLAGFLASRGHVYSWEVLLAPRPLQRREVKSSTHFGIFRGLGLWWVKEMVPIILRGWLSRGIVAISRDVKKRMVKEYFYPEKRVHVVTNGTDPQKYCPNPEIRAKTRRQLGFADEDVIILGVGRLCKQKRFERVITVFDELCALDPRVRLILVGDGDLRGELETLAASLKNSARIHFQGFQPDPVRYYMMADIFVLPSESEGFSGAMLEALSTGLISVFTDVSGVRETVEDGVNGFVVPQTQEGVREGLIRAISLSPKERSKIAATARQDIIKYFNKEFLIPKALNILGVRSKPVNRPRT